MKYSKVNEKIHNLNFNYGEFAIIKSQAIFNSYKLNAKELINTKSLASNVEYNYQDAVP